MIKDVSDLRVYKRALNLLRPIYRLASLIPDSHRKLRFQLIESCESIAPLIAEGYGKKYSEKEFKRFLQMALGSSDEAITHLREIKILAETITVVKQITCDALIDQYKIESKEIHNLFKKWVTF